VRDKAGSSFDSSLAMIYIYFFRISIQAHESLHGVQFEGNKAQRRGVHLHSMWSY
jgi:hypothetical protein